MHAGLGRRLEGCEFLSGDGFGRMLICECSAFRDLVYLVQKYVPWEDGSAELERISRAQGIGFAESDAECTLGLVGIGTS